MEARLRANPMDEEANKYFGEKIRLKQVHEQYELMQETFPESLGKILMLYINTKINGKEQIAFVDSGAQMTVMSKSCAEKLGILHLVDERFAGMAVGVGNAKILGKVRRRLEGRRAGRLEGSLTLPTHRLPFYPSLRSSPPLAPRRRSLLAAARSSPGPPC